MAAKEKTMTEEPSTGARCMPLWLSLVASSPAATSAHIVCLQIA